MDSPLFWHAACSKTGPPNQEEASVRPPAGFRVVQSVSRAAWRSTFNHRASESHIDLLHSFRFSVVSGISAAAFLVWSNAPKLARQLIQAVAECGNWLLLVILSSGEVKCALRQFRELLRDEWSRTMLWLNTRLAPWFDNPITCCGKLVKKRRRTKQKHWLQKLSRHLHG